MLDERSFKIENLFDAVFAAFFSMKRRARRLLADKNVGFTFEQVTVLNILDRHEGLNVSELAELADRDKTTTSRMVSGLERRNLVLRVPDKQDSRQKLIYLTQKAKERLADMHKLRAAFEKEAFKGIPAREMNAAKETLMKMIANLNKT